MERVMGRGLSIVFPPSIKAKLSEKQWEYMAFGPYPHWTQTRRALVKRGLYGDDGKTRTFLGDAVFELVRADLPRGDAQ
jgi:hypothetical protein